jgi:hypothetical protein
MEGKVLRERDPNMNFTKRIALLLATPAFAIACSSEPEVNSGLDGSKQVGSLTEAERKTLCDAAASAAGSVAEDAKAGSCRLAGVVAASFGGGGEAACEAAVTACEDAEPQPAEGGDDCSINTTDCTATVAEVEDCLNAQLSVTKDFLETVGSKSCGELLDPAQVMSIAQPTTPAECTALAAKCPGIGGTDTSTSAG